MKHEILSLERIYKQFDVTHAINGVSLRLYDSETVFVTGHPDSGKSVLAGVMCGAVPPDSGGVYYLGREARFPSEEAAYHRGIHRISPNRGIIGNVTVGENICLVRPSGFPRLGYAGRMNALARTVCENAGLDLDVRARPDELSLSPLDRILICSARAAYQRARIVIYDGVLHLFSGAETDRFIRMVKYLRGRGIAVCIFDSSPERSAEMADRVVLMRDGTIAADMSGFELTAEKICLLMRDPDPMPRVSAPRRRAGEGGGAPRPFAFPGPGGIPCEASVLRGETLGIFFRDQRDFYASLPLFSRDAIFALNKKRPAGSDISVITPDDLFHGSFPLLSCADNVLLPTLSKSGSRPRQHIAKYPVGLRQAFCGLLSSEPSTWDAPASEFSRYEQLEMVLCRYLALNTHIIFMVTLFSESNVRIRTMLRRFISNAAGRGKSVVVLEKDPELLEPICDKITNIGV